MLNPLNLDQFINKVLETLNKGPSSQFSGRDKQTYFYNDTDRELYKKYLNRLRLNQVEAHIAKEMAADFHAKHQAQRRRDELESNCFYISRTNLEDDASLQDIVRHSVSNKNTRTNTVLDANPNFARTYTFNHAKQSIQKPSQTYQAEPGKIGFQVNGTDNNFTAKVILNEPYNDYDTAYYQRYLDKLKLFDSKLIQARLHTEVDKRLNEAHKTYLKNDGCFTSTSYPKDGTLEEKITHALKPRYNGEPNRFMQVLTDTTDSGLGWIDTKTKAPTEACPQTFAAVWNMQRACENDTATAIIEKIKATHKRLKSTHFFTRSYFEDLQKLSGETDEFYLQKILNKALDGGTFFIGKSRTYEALQELGYLDSNGQPAVNCCQDFKEAWKAMHECRAAGVEVTCNPSATFK